MCEDVEGYTTVVGARGPMDQFLRRWSDLAIFQRFSLDQPEPRLIDLGELEGHVGDIFRDEAAPAVAVVAHPAGIGFRFAAQLQAELLTGNEQGSFSPLPELVCEPGFRFQAAQSGGGFNPALDPQKLTQVVASGPSVPGPHQVGGQRVALLDTGLQGTPNPMVDFIDCYNQGVRSQPLADDQHGHGTAVAQIIQATKPSADVHPLRVLNAYKVGKSYEVLAGLSYALWSGEFDIVNASLTSPASGRCESSLGKSVDYLVGYCRNNAKHTIPLIVAAAGNDGPNTSCEYPAVLPGVVVVLATDTNNQDAAYNSTPPQNATLQRAYGGSDTDPLGDITYPNRSPVALWGTSFAAAAVTGAYLP